MQNCPNTILTPHIGGSTEEAQFAIADEVATNMIAFVNSGRTMGAVNFPIIDQHFSQVGGKNDKTHAPFLI